MWMGGGGVRALSLYLSPCVVPFDLISFDAPPLVLFRIPDGLVLGPWFKICFSPARVGSLFDQLC